MKTLNKIHKASLDLSILELTGSLYTLEHMPHMYGEVQLDNQMINYDYINYNKIGFRILDVLRIPENNTSVIKIEFLNTDLGQLLERLFFDNQDNVKFIPRTFSYGAIVKTITIDAIIQNFEQ